MIGIMEMIRCNGTRKLLTPTLATQGLEWLDEEDERMRRGKRDRRRRKKTGRGRKRGRGAGDGGGASRGGGETAASASSLGEQSTALTLPHQGFQTPSAVVSKAAGQPAAMMLFGAAHASLPFSAGLVLRPAPWTYSKTMNHCSILPS